MFGLIVAVALLAAIVWRLEKERSKVRRGKP